jgi:hypothetical protein
MANTNTPFGFSQYRGGGSAPTYEQLAGQTAYNASAIYYGDPCQLDTNGQIIVGTGSATIAGVYSGCQYLSVSQKRTVWSNYWPGSDVASGNFVTSYYINDPNARFVAQTDSTGLTQAAVGANVGFAIGSPNTLSGISGAYIDVSTLSPSTTTLPFRVIGLVVDPPGVNGTAAGAYNLAIVAFNSVTSKTLVGI